MEKEDNLPNTFFGQVFKVSENFLPSGVSSLYFYSLALKGTHNKAVTVICDVKAPGDILESP